MRLSTVPTRLFARRLLFCAALLGCPAWAAANESFQLHVPVRAGQPAARVVITLQLAAAPTPGTTQVTIGGTSVVLPGLATIAGDRVILSAGVGNSVVIFYTLTSKFCAGTLCGGAGFASPACGVAAGTGADVQKDIDVQFTGPDIVSYRMNTYAVGAPDFFCGVAKKRIGTPNASLVPAAVGGMSALVATNKGRHPLDMVFVLDQSGSMGSAPPMGNPGDPSKWTILRSSLTTMVNRWSILDAPTPSSEWSRDRLGLVFFSSAATATAIAGGEGAGAFFKARGTDPPGATHDWSDVIAAIPVSPGGSTALGPGLNLGMDKWEAEPDSSRNDLVIIVMTDGMQNVAPLITTTPATSVLTLTPVDAGDPTQIFQRAIPMQAIAFGTPATTEHDLLENLAQQTSGVSFLALSAAGMSDAFADSLINTLKGDTASLAMRRHDTATGPQPGPLFPVIVDQSARRVVFSLEWTPPLSNALELQVFPPGTTPTSNPTGAVATHRVDSAQSNILGFDVNPATPGTWSVRVVRPQVVIGDDDGQPPQNPDVPYTLAVHFLEERLDFNASLVGVRQGTGDEIGIRLEIGYDDKPLAGLPANAIRVRIARPGESLGTILHDADVPLGPPAPVDTPPAHAQKTDQLAAQKKLNGILPQTVSTISLVDRGNGVYTGSFPDTTKTGLYQFEVVLDWDDPRTGKLRREERLERDVKLKPSAESTTVAATVQAGQHVLTVTPRDKFGNYLGPGFGYLVQATVTGTGTITGPTDDQQKGEYKFTITGLPPNITPDVKVTVAGVPVGGTFTGGSRYRLFLDVGANFPHGDLNDEVDGQISVNTGLEIFLMPATSVEAIVGYHGFDDGSSANPHMWQVSGNLKQYFGPGPVRGFVNAGGGVYHLDPAGTTKGGFNVGGGITCDLTPRVAVEGVYNFHTVQSSPSAQFSTLQFGVRIRVP